MVALAVNRTSEALAVGGGYVVMIGLVSYFIKEKLFMCKLSPLSVRPSLTTHS